jgi:hypothetical protein
MLQCGTIAEVARSQGIGGRVPRPSLSCRKRGVDMDGAVRDKQGTNVAADWKTSNILTGGMRYHEKQASVLRSDLQRVDDSAKMAA